MSYDSLHCSTVARTPNGRNSTNFGDKHGEDALCHIVSYSSLHCSADTKPTEFDETGLNLAKFGKNVCSGQRLRTSARVKEHATVQARGREYAVVQQAGPGGRGAATEG